MNPPSLSHKPRGWRLVETWTHSVNVNNKDFLNLHRFNEILVIARGITLSAVGIPFFYVSSDNGGAWLSGAGIYTSIASDGTVNDLTFGQPYFTGTAAARSFMLHIPAWNRAAKKPVLGTNPQLIETAAALNAIRFRAKQTSDFSTDANMTAGSIYLLGK